MKRGLFPTLQVLSHHGLWIREKDVDPWWGTEGRVERVNQHIRYKYEKKNTV